MLKYILKRLLLLIPVMLGVSVIIFAILSLSPGDPATSILGESATPEAVAELRAELGLDRPLIEQYFSYMKGIITLDFGVSWNSGVPVVEDLMARFPHTLKLALLGGIVVAVAVGLPIGVISAVKQYTFTDTAIMMFSLILSSVPGFWLALISVIIFSLTLKWLPSTGVDSWRHFVLPVFVVGFTSMSTLTRMARSTMLENIRADYIRTARAKGCTEHKIITKHALRNGLLPVITTIGTNFGRQLGGTVMIENVFAIPGIGTYITSAVRLKDIPAVMGAMIITCFLAGLVNLAVDVIFAMIDPRIKAQYTNK